MSKFFTLLLILILGSKNLLAQVSTIMEKQIDDDKNSFIEELILMVNPEDNTMGTKYSFALPHMKRLKSLKLEIEISFDNLLKQPLEQLEPDSVIYSFKEPKIVPDICFTPGTTRFVKTSVSISF